MLRTPKTIRSSVEPDWRRLAERASTEQDHAKLLQLVQALCDRLEELQTLDRSQAASDSPLSGA